MVIFLNNLDLDILFFEEITRGITLRKLDRLTLDYGSHLFVDIERCS